MYQDSIQDLCRALEAGYSNQNLIQGYPLKLESLETVMRIVTFGYTPYTWLNGVFYGVVRIYGCYYLFRWNNNSWEQVLVGPKARISCRMTYMKVFATNKWLTKRQVKRAKIYLNRHFPYGGLKAALDYPQK